METRTLPILPFLVLLLVAAALLACGGADSFTESGEDSSFVAYATAAPAATAAPSQAQMPAAAPTTAPAAAAAAERVESESLRAVEGGEDSGSPGSNGFFQGAPLTEEAQTSIQPQQNRVIVRTVDMSIIVPNVARASDDIVGMARGLGGWVVGSDRSQEHQSFLSVRVPAATLDDFVLSIRDLAASVEFETSSSQDVTDAFVDNQARLNGLRSTEARLFQFLEQSVNVEEALNVQAQLANVQLEMELIQGRLRFLSETAAYSLVNLSLTTKPGDMSVEIGSDSATYRAGLRATFRATFLPPEGVDEFRFTWDFGDGSRPVEGGRTAPTANEGERVTSTVAHTFTDLEQSPYIVQVDITGIGNAGLFIGSDTLIATITEIPGIEVFAGQDRVVDEGEEVEYTGSFTRPASLWDYRYRWDFGDGSATVFEEPEQDETRAVGLHTFPNHRPAPYPVVLTVIAQSEAGEIRGSSAFNVRVNEVEGFVVAGWDAGGTAKTAVRALSVVGQVLLTILIWVGIFSPVWLAILAVLILLPRLRRRFGWGPGGGPFAPMPRAPWQSRSAGTGSAEAASDRPGESAGAEAPEFDASEANQRAGENSPSADETETTGIVCSSCGGQYPAVEATGQPSRFCPYCGGPASVSQ